MVTASYPAIARLPARQLAWRELARPIYQPPPWDRLLHDVIGWLSGLSIGGLSLGSGVALRVLLAVAAVAIVAAVAYWMGPTRRSRRRPGSPLLQGQRLGAADHRRQAEQLAAAGDYAGAIIETIRAIAVDLEDRGILSQRPGRTADELAIEAAGPLPGRATELQAAARLFDDVRYGDRPGTPAGYQQVHELDLSVRAARTAVATVSQAGGRESLP
ncbi:MAG: DUF4129 domain-containing protein [Streptosporangiaceae bacterium]|jgi:hypothetical protein